MVEFYFSSNLGQGVFVSVSEVLFVGKGFLYRGTKFHGISFMHQYVVVGITFVKGRQLILEKGFVQLKPLIMVKVQEMLLAQL